MRSIFTRRLTVWLVILAVALVGLATGGCQPGASPVDGAAAASSATNSAATNVSKPVIAVSIFPVASLVEQLTTPWADVVTLLPAGASEHNAELHPDQLRQLSRAEILVVVGRGLDEWAEQAAANAAPNLKPTRFGDLIADSAEHSPPSANNHLWLDPVTTQTFVAALSETLAKKFPAHDKEIHAAAEKLQTDLAQLDTEYREQLARVPTHELITFHNAFDLIAARYGLKIVARLTEIEVSPGGEVTPQHLLEAIQAVDRFHLAVIYGEPEFSDEVLAAIRRQTGAEVLELDPLGSAKQPGYASYQEMMRSNLKTLVQGQWRARKPTSPSAVEDTAPSGKAFP